MGKKLIQVKRKTKIMKYICIINYFKNVLMLGNSRKKYFKKNIMFQINLLQ